MLRAWPLAQLLKTSVFASPKIKLKNTYFYIYGARDFTGLPFSSHIYILDAKLTALCVVM